MQSIGIKINSINVKQTSIISFTPVFTEPLHLCGAVLKYETLHILFFSFISVILHEENNILYIQYYLQKTSFM